MSRHSFDSDIAKTVGVNAAVIFQNIVWWCERNAVKGRNIHDENAWTFNSVSQFSKMFPYLTAKQIRTALDRLIDGGFLEVGSYNKDLRDRTKWYAVNRNLPFAREVTAHLPSMAETFAPEGRPLPVGKPVGKPDNTQGSVNGSDEPPLFSALEEQEESKTDLVGEGFQAFWQDIWPKHQRKTAKADCEKVYRAACDGKHPKADSIAPTELNRCTQAYIRSVDDHQYLKAPLAWLRVPGWEPFIGQTAPRRAPVSSPSFMERVR